MIKPPDIIVGGFLKMNILILLESWVTIPLVIFALWSQLGLREGQQP
ncbi:MAG: hypothetical protein AAFX95_06635 [Cyanobacteria bacterium J06639_16]